MRKHLRHSNIVYCLGASLNPPQFVSTWMSGGGLREYLTGYPEGNSLSLVGPLPAVSCEALTLFTSRTMSLRVWNTFIRLV